MTPDQIIDLVKNQLIADGVAGGNISDEPDEYDWNKKSDVALVWWTSRQSVSGVSDRRLFSLSVSIDARIKKGAAPRKVATLFLNTLTQSLLRLYKEQLRASGTTDIAFGEAQILIQDDSTTMGISQPITINYVESFNG